MKATLARVRRLNPELNAFVDLDEATAMAQARAAEQQFQVGIDLGPMHGIIVSVKDNIDVAGTRTTGGSAVLRDAPPAFRDADVVRGLRSGGALIVGKTNLYEFAFGEPAPSDIARHVRNPRRYGFQSGGSSHGSAVAVAAGLSMVSLGTDTGGSVRHPAALCGVVGLKPTLGAISMRGVIPVSSRLDQVGVLSRSVDDLGSCLRALTRKPLGLIDGEQPASSLLGLRLGLPTNDFFSVGEAAVAEVVSGCRAVLSGAGMTPIPVHLPRVEETNHLADLIMTVDVCVVHQQFRDRDELYTASFVERSRPGRELTAIEYATALDARVEIRASWLDIFKAVDVVLMPGNAIEAPPVGQRTVTIAGETYPTRMITSRFTRAASLVGFPSLMVPAGEGARGLPVGVQLVGPPWSELRLLRVGTFLEEAMGRVVARWGIDPNNGGPINADQ